MQPDRRNSAGWRNLVFKNRGLLLVPSALVLVVFGQPTATSAIVGITIAAIGELLRISAVGYSGVTTRANIVTAPQLVTAGPYSYIRNPLYLGNAITAIGFWLAFSGAVTAIVSLLMLIVVIGSVAFVYATIIPLEEAYLSATFGAPYDRYVERVPRLVPSPYPLPRSEQHGTWHSEVILRAEIVTIGFFVVMAAAVIYKLRS